LGGGAREGFFAESQMSKISLLDAVSTLIQPSQLDAEKSLLARDEALFRVSRAINVYRDPRELFKVLADELRHVVEFDFVALFLYDEATNKIQNAGLETLHGPGFFIPPNFPAEETITWWVYRHQEPVLIFSRDEEVRFPGMMGNFKHYGVESACILPLTTAYRRLGSLSFGARHPNAYSSDEIRHLSLVADQVALAVDNALREDELRKQKAHFEKLFELAPEAIVLRDINNRVLRANQEFTKLFGYTVEEALGRNINDLILPEGSLEESEALRLALKSGERVNAELTRKRKDGSHLDVSFVAAPVSVDGSTPEIYGIYRDITERKQAEEALKRSEAYLSEAQRLSHTGSWARSVSTGDVVLSAESYRILGFEPKTKITLEFLLGRVHPEDRSAYAGVIQKAIQEVSDFEMDYRIILDDGSISHIHSVGHPVKCATGAPVEFVGTIVDATGQERSRKALEDALAEINSLKEQLFHENIALRQEIEETSMFEEIVGKSSALQKVLKELETVGPTDSTVLIYGETGTGKELIARAIHNLSSRRANAFVKVNCAAIPTGLLESELFGHERGAFTGAISQRIGRFELANHGTVFLDEIGEVPLELQPKLLRVLQEREFERLGSSRTQGTDARLIAATNRDLSEMVAEQKFRSDLFYRLNVFPLYVPALRERPEDVPLLVRHFAELFSRRIGKAIHAIPAETMNALMRYDWPGNVRELQNVIERAVILSTRGVLRVSMSELNTKANAAPRSTEPVAQTRRRVRVSVPPLNRDKVLQALHESGGRVGGVDGAAARLGLKRTTLIAQLKRLAIDPQSVTRQS
jgi:PAS domain S-box-containing protein